MTINTCIPNSSATKTITNNNYANITTNTNTTSTNDIVPIQSDADRRTFRRVVAPNGIECLFVKDVHSKTLAASCCVGSGASSDPYEFPGLAHFCEHMCFLGSKDHPGENEYKRYLSSHGGRSNASTSMERTSYKFEILSEYGERALHIFAGFFIKPLLSSDGAIREVNAVDAENSKNKSDDGRRRLQVLKALADVDHHYSKFSTGDGLTLSDYHIRDDGSDENGGGDGDGDGGGGGIITVREALLAFHRRHYRPDNMVVVVVGPQSLDELEEWTVSRFGRVTDRWWGDNNDDGDTQAHTLVQDQDQNQNQTSLTENIDSIDVDQTDDDDINNEQRIFIHRLIDTAAKHAPSNRYQPNLNPQSDHLSVPYNPAFYPNSHPNLMTNNTTTDTTPLNNNNNTWPLLITTLPLRSTRKLILLFPLPPTRHIPDADPINLLSHLIGHEGYGSSFAHLQCKAYIDSMVAGTRINAVDQCLFKIEISLTEEGDVDDNWIYVVDVVMKHCRYIYERAKDASLSSSSSLPSSTVIDEGPDNEQKMNDNNRSTLLATNEALKDLRRIWNEIVKLNTASFHHTSPPSAYDAAPSLAYSVFGYGVRQCLSAGYMLGNEDVGSLSNTNNDTQQQHLPLDALLDFSARLIPENCIVERCGQRAWDERNDKEGKEKEKVKEKDEVDSTNLKQGSLIFGRNKEKWYGVEFFLDPVRRYYPSALSVWGRGEEGIEDEKCKDKGRKVAEDHSSSPSLNLPGPNTYVPRNYDLCEELPEEAKLGPRIDEKDVEPPRLVIERSRGWQQCVNKNKREDNMEKGREVKEMENEDKDNELSGRLWHRLDDRYALPRSSLALLIRTPAIDHVCIGGSNGVAPSWKYDDRTALLSSVLSSAFSDAAAIKTYDAHLAGLRWNVGRVHGGLILQCTGYSDRLSGLALSLMKDLLSIGGGGVDGNSSSNSKEVGMDNGETFLKQSHVDSARDRVARRYKSMLRSGRADSHAAYYRDLLLMSRGGDAVSCLNAVKGINVSDLEEHRRNILHDRNVEVDCLYSGNVCERHASSFFEKAMGLLEEARNQDVRVINAGDDVNNRRNIDDVGNSTRLLPSSRWMSGSLVRRLERGKDIELHFSSKNPEERNGSVLMTFQSPVPAYKGSKISSQESLNHTAAIRLICHMLREPLFDELRTKQQLGYVVSSYYDLNNSVQEQASHTATKNGQSTNSVYTPATTPVNSIVVNILSKKFPPAEVALRIDAFLIDFARTIATMPWSEVEDHADALSRKLTRPIQKLGDESSRNFSKVRHHFPEVRTLNRDTVLDMPWNNTKALAKAIKLLSRNDLLGVWKDVVSGTNRSRVVSCVYGKTFPLEQNEKTLEIEIGLSKNTTMIKTLDNLMEKRQMLEPYNGDRTTLTFSRLPITILSNLKMKKSLRLAAFTALGVGVGFLGLTYFSGEDKKCKNKSR